MMNRVKPQQEVKEARDRITIHSINKANGKILSVSDSHIDDDDLQPSEIRNVALSFFAEIFETEIARRDATLDENE